MCNKLKYNYNTYNKSLINFYFHMLWGLSQN